MELIIIIWGRHWPLSRTKVSSLLVLVLPHNLRALRHEDGSVPSWALEFDTWLKDALLDGRYEDVNQYEERAPHAKAAHPWPDHFYPLHIAIGAAGENSKGELIHHSWQLGTLSYASYKFTTTE